MKRKHIFFTGGGSGGHVVPAITLINELLKQENVAVHYIGGYKSIERELVSKLPVYYNSIFTGKLRRYFSLKNFSDFFKFILGICQSLFFLFPYKSNDTLIFSTGGFVSLPVVIAGFIQRKKIYIHEQTSCVGLANKIASYFADKIFVSFESSLKNFPQNKVVYSGYPLRSEIFSGEKMDVSFGTFSLCDSLKPILFFTGGGNGSSLINDIVENNIEELKSRYRIIHQAGKNFVKNFKKYEDHDYIVFDFIGKEMVDIIKRSDLIVARSGAGTVSELMALNKRVIFIPLKIAQKNEQYFNALEAQKKIDATIVLEDHVKKQDWVDLISNSIQKPLTNFKLQNDARVFLINEINKCI